MPQSRQLAAIMFTDIVGYTTLMGNDEKNAFTLLNKNRQLQKPIIGAFDGRWIKELGDGTMASFNTVSDAVNAAIKIQEACNSANDFQLRIGIHQGEVVFENDDVFGDAVNIAARIQAAANPGCIFISETVNHNIANKKYIKTQFIKEEILKNVSQPVRMYQVLFAGSEILIPKPAAVVIENSIAVLPFVNMSSDPEQEFFSDGISEEIINMLAQVKELKVIGRTSCFAFKGKNLDIKFIGEQLKVSHILEGSVRKSGNKLRITAQLIKVADGFHLYSEKFDRELEDIFTIQDEISEAILKAVKIKLLDEERVDVFKKYTDNIEAYQLFLKGRYYLNKFSPDNLLKAIEYYQSAIDLDPNYAIAYADKAFCYMNLRDLFGLPPEKCVPQALEAAEQAFELDDEIAQSHLAVGRIKLHWDWNVKEATENFKKALFMDPNSAECHMQLGFCLVLTGNTIEAMEHANTAESLDPLSVLNIWYATTIPWATGKYEKVLANGKRLIDLEPNFFSGHMWAMAANMALGRFEEATAEAEITVKLNPGPLFLAWLGMNYGITEQKEKAREIIKKLEKFEGADISNLNLAIGDVYLGLGEWDNAYNYYEKGIEKREQHMQWEKYMWQVFPEFFAQPKTKELLERIEDCF